jgi:hypothetical protein
MIQQVGQMRYHYHCSQVFLLIAIFFGFTDTALTLDTHDYSLLRHETLSFIFAKLQESLEKGFSSDSRL